MGGHLWCHSCESTLILWINCLLDQERCILAWGMQLLSQWHNLSSLSWHIYVYIRVSAQFSYQSMLHKDVASNLNFLSERLVDQFRNVLRRSRFHPLSENTWHSEECWICTSFLWDNVAPAALCQANSERTLVNETRKILLLPKPMETEEVCSVDCQLHAVLTLSLVSQLNCAYQLQGKSALCISWVFSFNDHLTWALSYIIIIQRLANAFKYSWMCVHSTCTFHTCFGADKHVQLWWQIQFCDQYALLLIPAVLQQA